MKFAESFRRSQAISAAAKEECVLHGHPQIDLEHLFFALLIVGGASSRILSDAGITLSAARTAAAAVHADQVGSLGVIAPALPLQVQQSDPAMLETHWSERALEVMSSDFSLDDRTVLQAILDEPSGDIGRVLARLQASESEIREAMSTYVEAPRVTRNTATGPGWQDVTHSRHVPAPRSAVWLRVSDPARRLEWETDQDATWTVTRSVTEEVIEWEQVEPGATTVRLRVHIAADGAGTQLALTRARAVPSDLRRRLLNPLYTFFTQQELRARARKISLSLR